MDLRIRLISDSETFAPCSAVIPNRCAWHFVFLAIKLGHFLCYEHSSLTAKLEKTCEEKKSLLGLALDVSQDFREKSFDLPIFFSTMRAQNGLSAKMPFCGSWRYFFR